MPQGNWRDDALNLPQVLLFARHRYEFRGRETLLTSLLSVEPPFPRACSYTIATRWASTVRCARRRYHCRHRGDQDSGFGRNPLKTSNIPFLEHHTRPPGGQRLPHGVGRSGGSPFISKAATSSRVTWSRSSGIRVDASAARLQIFRLRTHRVSRGSGGARVDVCQSDSYNLIHLNRLFEDPRHGKGSTADPARG